MTDLEKSVRHIYEHLNKEEISYKPSTLELVKEDEVCYNFMFDKPQGSGLFYHFLNQLVKHAPIKTIVELGNRRGLGTLSIADGMTKDQTFFTVDIVKDLRYVPSEILERDNVYSFVGDCLTLKTFKTKRPENIDLLFCDTVHTYQQVSKEFELYKKFLSKQAVVLVDDINFNDKGQFVDEWKYGEVIRCDKLHGTGFGICFYEEEIK